jgi:hypothetical protein
MEYFSFRNQLVYRPVSGTEAEQALVLEDGQGARAIDNHPSTILDVL